MFVPGTPMGELRHALSLKLTGLLFVEKNHLRQAMQNQ